MQERLTVMNQPVLITPQQTPSWRVKDVAAWFGVKAGAVYRWVYNGQLPVHRTPGGGLRFVESEVKAAQSREERHG
jgi:excisionase family DNA binding protein